MVRKYIKRDFTDHIQTTQYISDEDEYIKFEMFSFDPSYTKTYVVESNTLVGENVRKTSFKAWTCFQSKDRINPMEFTLNYDVKDSGTYRIDILYEQNSNMYPTDYKEYNTGKDLVGWYDIYESGSKKEHKAEVMTSEKITKNTPKAVKKALNKAIANANKNIVSKPKTYLNLKFEGENNVLKRKTIFTNFSKGKFKIEFGVPHNCYVFGAIVRKVIKFWGTNNDEAGTNLQFTNATLTKSEMLKAKELQCSIGYDDDFECESSPSGLYMDYMDECNLYVKDVEGNIKRVFGGYVSTPLPDNDRKKLTIHCADRLRDGENKYILDQLMLQKGDGETPDHEAKDVINFNKHSEVLNYLCKLYEISLNNNIDKNYRVEGETYTKGFKITFGKNKDIKKVPVSNGKVTINKNSVTLRNNSSGKKKQVWTLYDGKKYRKTPERISDYHIDTFPLNFHITYGLGNVKTEHKSKESVTVDVADATAGSQKFGKCGVSQDKKYIMAIGTVSSKKDKGKYGQYYKTIFKNKCPHCHQPTLRWDSCRTDTKCIYTAHWNGSKRTWSRGIPAIETEITCNNKDCDSDYSALGNEKDAPYKKLTKVSSTVKSSKAEQDKLHKGEMVAVPSSNMKVSSDDIFQAIKNGCKGWTHKTKTGSTANYLEKHGVGDCWAWSDWISKQLKRYKVNHKIVKYGTGDSGEHRSVMYVNSKGKYVDFPYKKYNFPSGTHATAKSKTAPAHYTYKQGGRIDQAIVSGSTKKSQTNETTITKGYDKDKPFQAYLDICYSTTGSFKAKKYHIHLDFTQKSKSNVSKSGLNPVWVNNASKRITLKGIIDIIRDYHGSKVEVYLHSISFVTPKIVTTNENKNTDWYTVDKATIDNSSCKMILYSIEFSNDAGTEPSDLKACGQSVNEIMSNIVEEANYIVDMEYGAHRKDDKILFKVNTNNSPVFTATEGNENNILEWGNISYNPANELFNMSRCVFMKNNTDKYFYVDSKFSESILKYQEQCTLITENEPIGEKEAYWNARHNEKFNPEQTYSYTITVKGYPDVRMKDLVEVIANTKKLNTLKEVDSITMKYDSSTKPVIQTELGLGELAPDLQVRQNIRKLRDNAKKKTTDFSKSASPVTDTNVYEWEY